jgi:hypothetical protein
MRKEFLALTLGVAQTGSEQTQSGILAFDLPPMPGFPWMEWMCSAGH